MATAIGDLVVRFGGQTRGFDRAAGRVQGGLRRITSAMSRLPGIGMFLTGTGLVAGLGMATRAAKIQEDAERKLAAVIRATGGAAGFSAKELNTFAAQLQRVTNYGDEATISAMAVLATFKQIKGDQFKAATRAAQDMATVMGTSLQSAIMQIGKAMNDPATGLTMLTRVGITFTEQQKEQIKTLQEANDMMGAQRVILAELESQFGGAAKALADPMVQFKNALGDVTEKIGQKLLPYLRAMADDMTRVAENAQKAGQQTSKWGSVTEFWVGGTLDLLDATYQGWLFIKTGITATIAAMAEGVAKVWELMAAVPGAGKTLKDQAKEIREIADSWWSSTREYAEAAREAFLDKTPSERAEQMARRMAKQAENAKRFAEGAADAMGEMADKLEATEELVDIDTTAVDRISEMQDRIFQLQTGASGAWLEIRKLGQLEGVDFAKWSQMVELQARLDDLGKAAQLKERFADPAEKMREQFADIERLFKSGAIGAGTRARALADLEKQIAGAEPTADRPRRFGAAMEKGRAETIHTILAAQAGSDTEGKQQVRELKSSNQKLQALLEEIRGIRNDDPEVVSFPGG